MALKLHFTSRLTKNMTNVIHKLCCLFEMFVILTLKYDMGSVMKHLHIPRYSLWLLKINTDKVRKGPAEHCKFTGAKLNLYQSKSKLTLTVKVTCLKSTVPLERYGHMEHICQIWMPSLLQLESYGQCWKVGQRSRSGSHVQNSWYRRKGLVTRNTHAKYESPISYDEKVMASVKVFQK